jgi:GT2 family glycosyltransferase
MRRVYIILVNWNGWSDTLACLESLVLLNYPDFRIVVCDNGSTNDSSLRIRQWMHSRPERFAEYSRSVGEHGGDGGEDAPLVLINTGSNLGFAGGSNVGIRYAMARGDGDYCWLLNNDTVTEPDALSHLVTRMQEDQSIGICGSTLRLYAKQERVQALGGGHYYRWIGLPWHYGRFSHWPGTVPRQPAESRMNYIEGASMLVSRQFIEQVGLLC